MLDPEGRRVVQFSSVVTAGEEGSDGFPIEPSVAGWRRIYEVLLLELSRRAAECEELRAREAALTERLEAVEAERDQANAIAEDLYQGFRERVRRVQSRRRFQEKPGPR